MTIRQPDVRHEISHFKYGGQKVLTSIIAKLTEPADGTACLKDRSPSANCQALTPTGKLRSNAGSAPERPVDGFLDMRDFHSLMNCAEICSLTSSTSNQSRFLLHGQSRMDRFFLSRNRSRRRRKLIQISPRDRTQGIR